MTRHRLIVAAAAAMALTASPASAETAYFKVSFTAAEELSWREDVTTEGCGARGVFAFSGAGRSAIRVRTRRPVVVAAERVADPRRIALRFRQGGLLPVTGTYRREGGSTGVVLTPGDEQRCGADPGEVWEPDCGTRRYPADARLQVEWLIPSRWPVLQPAPLVPSVTFSGPYTDESPWQAFRNCRGFDLAGALGVVTPAGRESTAGSLPPARVFGRAPRITVRGHARGTHALTAGVLSGARTVTTRLDWTMRLMRLARRPRGL